MKKTIEIPEGYKARIEGNKVILEPKECEDKAFIELIKGILHFHHKNGIFDTTGIKYFGGRLVKDKEILAWLEKQGEKIDAIENFDTEFEKQVSHLIASAINKEYEYSQGFVKWTANALLNYAKHELEKHNDQKVKDLSDDAPVAEHPDMVAQLKEYLAITPKEQLNKDWEELKSWGDIGPTVEEFLYRKPKSMQLTPAIVAKMVEEYANTPEMGNEDFGKPVNCMVRAYENGINDTLEKIASMQGWTSADDRLVEIIIDILDRENHNGRLLKGDLKDCVRFIRNIKYRVQRPEPEWSDEDEKCVTAFLNMCCRPHDEMDGRPWGKWYERLKTFKDRIQPHWKPTMEQLIYLKAAFEKYDFCDSERGALESLYNDIKKL